LRGPAKRRRGLKACDDEAGKEIRVSVQLCAHQRTKYVGERWADPMYESDCVLDDAFEA
jgi:hypothetical protein